MTHEFYIYQIIIFITAIFFVVRAFLKVLTKNKTIREFIIAAIIWGAFSFLSLFPNLSTIVANYLGFQLGINALLVFSVLILFFICVSLLMRSDKIDTSVTKVVRELALSDLKKVNGDSPKQVL